jgi:hypothetical protein
MHAQSWVNTPSWTRHMEANCIPIQLTIPAHSKVKCGGFFYIYRGCRPDRLAGGVRALNTFSRAFSTQTVYPLSSAPIKL